MVNLRTAYLDWLLPYVFQFNTFIIKRPYQLGLIDRLPGLILKLDRAEVKTFPVSKGKDLVDDLFGDVHRQIINYEVTVLRVYLL